MTTAAFILAAGFGTRLGEITKTTPKCLVPVAGKPLIAYVVEKIAAAGIRKVVINLHYLPDAVRDYFQSNNNFGLDVQFSYEPKILGTGGGLVQASALFNEVDSVLIHNADIYSEFPLAQLISSHKNSRNVVTLVTAPYKKGASLLFSKETNCLVDWDSPENTDRRFSESVQILKKQFIGVSLVSRKLFDYVSKPPDTEYSLIELVLAAARAGEKVMSCSTEAHYWIDAGTKEDLQMLETHIKV